MALDLFLKTKKGKGNLLNAFVAGMFELLKEKHKRPALDRDLGTNEAIEFVIDGISFTSDIIPRRQPRGGSHFRPGTTANLGWGQFVPT